MESKQHKSEASKSLAKEAAALAASSLVQSMLETAPEIHAKALETIKCDFPVPLDLATSLVSSVSYIALALNLNQAEFRFFPKNWVEPSCKTNPDFIMSCVLCQLANYSYSVIQLVSKGLDTPSRALLRSTGELSYMIAALSVDRETLQTYILDESSPPKETWYKLFSSRKLEARLSKVDQQLGVPNDWTNFFKSFREEKSEFFSEAIHHSKRSVIIGALPTNTQSDLIHLALLGGSPSASKETLDQLLFVLNYALTTFIASTKSRPNHQPEFSNPNLWHWGVSIHEAVQPLYSAHLQSAVA